MSRNKPLSCLYSVTSLSLFIPTYLKYEQKKLCAPLRFPLRSEAEKYIIPMLTDLI